MGKICISYLNKIQFKIWRVAFFKSINHRHYGMDFRFAGNNKHRVQMHWVSVDVFL